MALLSPLFFQNQDPSEQNADVARLFIRDVFNESAGIIQEDAFVVSERGAGANDSVDVGPGGLIIPGTESGVQGFYYFVNDSTVNVTMADPAHSTLPRIDTIVVYAGDSFYSGTDDNGFIEYVTGTADSDPDPPDLDALGYENYWRLADIDVPAADDVIADSEITDTRTDGTLTPAQGRANATGGIGIASSATRDILYPNPRDGQHVWLTDDVVLQVWDAGSASWLVVAQESEVPAASGFRTGTQSVPDATVTVAEINTVNWDNDGAISLVNNRFIAQTPGLYAIQSRITRDGGLTALNTVSLALRKNGIQIPGIEDVHASTNLFGGSWASSTIINLDVGDFFDAVIFQSSGGSRIFRHRDISFTFQARLPS